MLRNRGLSHYHQAHWVDLIVRIRVLAEKQESIACGHLDDYCGSNLRLGVHVPKRNAAMLFCSLFVGFPQACIVYFFTEDLPLFPTDSGNIRVSQR
jgi:hypothetical protein